MKPNGGLFFIGARGQPYRQFSKRTYLRANPWFRFATHSGPMLVIDGRHSSEALNAGARSRGRPAMA